MNLLPETSADTAPAVFPQDVPALGERIAALRASLRASLGEPMGASMQAEAVLAELDTAYEELRVADDEVRAQQEEIRRLSDNQQLLRWQHQRVMQMLHVPVVTTDLTGTIQSANAAAAGMVGIQLPHLLRKPLPALVATEDRPGLRQQLLGLKPGQRLRRTITLVGRDGQSVLVEANATVEAESSRVTWIFLTAAAGEPAGIDHGDLPAALVRLAALPALGLKDAELLQEAATIAQAVLGDRVVVSINAGSPASPAALSSSSTVAQTIDGAQLALEEGPCVTAFERRRTIVTTKMGADARWPRFASDPRVRGAGGAIAVPLKLGDDLLGALNVYGDVGDPPSGRLVESAELLAAGVAAVLYELSVHHELELAAADMERALASRATIDQARGMIMADRGCSAEEAFDHLVHLSSTQHVKLRDLARQIVDSRSSAAG